MWQDKKNPLKANIVQLGGLKGDYEKRRQYDIYKYQISWAS